MAELGVAVRHIEEHGRDFYWWPWHDVFGCDYCRIYERLVDARKGP